MRGGEPFKRIARRRAAHAGAGQACAQPVAHHQRLAVAFGELLAVMAAELLGEPAAVGMGKRLDRQLREVGPGSDRLVEQAEPGGIDQVLGIVEHHHREATACTRLVGHHRRIETVEAIGLGARPVAVVNHQSQPRIAPGRGDRGGERGGIVAVAADVKPQGRLRPAPEEMRDGVADHRRLLPRRHQHRGRFVKRAVAQRGAVAKGGLCPPGQAKPQPQRIDRDIISGADQEEDPGEQQ